MKHASKQVRFETRKITTEHRAQKVAQTPLRPYFVSKSEQVFKKTPKEKFKDVGKAVIEQNKQNAQLRKHYREPLQEVRRKQK